MFHYNIIQWNEEVRSVFSVHGKAEESKQFINTDGKTN